MAETKKSRRNRDPRTITTGIFGSNDLVYPELTIQDWDAIQRRFGKKTKISDVARAQLNGVTAIYSLHGQLGRRAESLSAVIRHIEKWRRQTSALRNFVWTQRDRTPVKKTPESLSSLLRHYFRSELKGFERVYPVMQLARFLDGAGMIAQYFVDTIGNRENDNKRYDSSLAWVALVISICDRNSLPVMIFYGRRRKLHPGFIELLDRLQKIIHHENQEDTQREHLETVGRTRPAKSVKRRSIIPKMRKESSLKKLALQAYDIAQGSPAEELFVLLSYWAIGQTHISKDIIFGLDIADLNLIQTRISNQRRSRRTEKNITQIKK